MTAPLANTGRVPDADSLKRLGGGRWETRDGRFAIEPQSGTWVIVDNEQTDELGLPLVRGPFGSLTAAKEAIEAARSEGPKASPLADRLERARRSDGASANASKPSNGGPSTGRSRTPSATPAHEPNPTPKPAKPEPPPEPKWLRDLEPGKHRRARDLIARLGKMGIADAERIVRAEIADGQPALAQLALERAIAKAAAASREPAAAVRAAVRAVLRGADVELGVSWRLVDDQDRRIEKINLGD